MEYEEHIRDTLAFHGQVNIEESAAKAKAFDIWVKTAPIGFAKVGSTGNFLEVNQTLCKFLQRTEPELIGSSFAAITPTPLREWDLAMVERVVSGEIDDYILPKVYEIAHREYRFAVIHPVAFRKMKGGLDHFWVLIIPTDLENIVSLQKEMVGKVILPEQLYTSRKKRWLPCLLTYVAKHWKETARMIGAIGFGLWLVLEMIAERKHISVGEFLNGILR